MKFVLTVFLCAFGCLSTAQATLLTASFRGTVSSLAGTTDLVQVGDAFSGILRFDSSVPASGWRIDTDDARFIWRAWEYPGPPPLRPLPLFIGMHNLRNGERFDVPAPGVPYDPTGLSPTATIDFDTLGANQALEFAVDSGSVASAGGAAALHLEGDGAAFFDTFDMGPGMVNSIDGDVVLGRSFAHFGLGHPQLGGFEFNVALSDFRFGPLDQTVPEPNDLALAATALALAGVMRRKR